MKETERQAAERLRKILSGECPNDFRVSFSYSGNEPGKSETEATERFSKNLHLRAARKQGAIC